MIMENPYITENLLAKKYFDIEDFARIVNKDQRTIRSWEIKGIIKKPPKDSRNWRRYSRADLAECLETILNYPWKRRVIKNEEEIQYVIDRLHGKVYHYTISGVNFD